MDEEQINSKFEELLGDVNLVNNKRILLKDSSVEYKNRMLQLRLKIFNEIKKHHEFKNPQDYINYLKQCFDVDSENPDAILDCLSSLRIALANYSLQWSREFGHNGIATLCDVLKKAKAFNSDENFVKIQVEAIKSITKFAGNIEGAQEVLGSKSNIIDTIVTCIDYEKLDIAKVALKLMTSLLNQSGLENYATKIFLRTLNDFSEQNNVERFKIIVDGILLTEAEEIWEYCLLFITSLLSNINEVEDRITIRSEILNRCGLESKMDILRRSSYIEPLISTLDRQVIEDELEFELKNQLLVKM